VGGKGREWEMGEKDSWHVTEAGRLVSRRRRSAGKQLDGRSVLEKY